MNKRLVALAFCASLLSTSFLSTSAIAQMPGHDAHHPAPPAGEQAQPAPAPGPMGPGMMGQGRMGEGMMGQGMMRCPMMQGMPMQGMPMQGMPMQGMPMQGHSGPAGDQSVPSLALHAVNEKMHREMAITFTGDADVDFARAMIAHHRGAVDMARIVLAFGTDERIRDLANAVVEAQEDEIRMMEAWLAERDAR